MNRHLEETTMFKRQLMIAMVALVSPAVFANDPTFSCKDGVGLASAVYDRVVRAHTAQRIDQAKTAAEDFWDVANAFDKFSLVGALGTAVANIGYAKGTKPTTGASNRRWGLQCLRQSGHDQLAGDECLPSPRMPRSP